MTTIGPHLLGRRYEFDPRDFRLATIHPAHAALPIPRSALWADTVVLDQGDFGTCVGNGFAGFGISDPIDDAYTEKDARAIYYEATVIDGHPDDPDAPGGGQQGSTVRSGAKAMVARGRLRGFAFTTDLNAIIEWLGLHGPVVFGSDWTKDMFTPDAQGFIHPTGAVEGGHCYVAIGYDLNAGWLRFRQSWGKGWGPLGGDFLVALPDVAKLLGGIESPGEACVADEVALVPVPGPTPDPAPAPAPAPAPTPAPPDQTWLEELEAFWHIIVKWMDGFFRRHKGAK